MSARNQSRLSFPFRAEAVFFLQIGRPRQKPAALRPVVKRKPWLDGRVTANENGRRRAVVPLAGLEPRRGFSHTAIMSGGYMILVRTARMGGFEDMKEIWFAHIPDRERAVQAVERRPVPPKEL